MGYLPYREKCHTYQTFFSEECKNKKKTARTRQAKTKTVECYILIRESAVRGPETELMKINCPEESREKLNLSTYLIQYRVLRQPPAGRRHPAQIQPSSARQQAQK